MDQQQAAEKQVVIIEARAAIRSSLIAYPRMATVAAYWCLRALFSIFCALMIVALSGFLTYRQMTGTQMLREERVRLERYLEGTVPKPFAYRVLIPQSIALLARMLPESLLSSGERWSELLFLQQVAPASGMPIHYSLLAALLNTSLLVYAAMSYLLYRELFASPWWYSALVPVLALVALIPFVSSGVGHVYDFTALMFIVAMLYAMATHRHWLFLFLFAASCLNKETTLLLTVAYASYFYDRLPRREFLLYVGIQCLTFAFVYGYLRYHFEANPGMGMEHWGLWWNQKVPYSRWMGHVRWFTGRSFQDIATILVILLLLAFHWRNKPLVLRRAAAMLLPHIAIFLIGAVPGEVRNLYESVPLLTLFVCRNIEHFGTNGLGTPARTWPEANK